MPTAIALSALNDTARRVEDLWDWASRLEDQPSMRALAYRPHVTLAIYDDLDSDDLLPALRAFEGRPALRITFDRIRAFEGTPIVLWAAPRACPALEEAHASVHRLVDPALCRPHYRPGTWVPHCTLANAVSERCRAEALAVAESAIGPFDVLFDRAECVRFPPVAVADARVLGPLAIS